MKVQDIFAALEFWDRKHISDEEFLEIVEKAKILNALGNEQRLLLYGYALMTILITIKIHGRVTFKYIYLI